MRSRCLPARQSGTYIAHVDCSGSPMRGSQFAKLTAFVAVADHGNFTRAAAFLGMATPSLSLAIRSLEEELGVRLLNRTTRGVALTEAGERLLAQLHPVMDAFDHAVETIQAVRDKQ